MVFSIHPIPLVLATLSAALVLLERWRGAALTLELHWKGDLKRETRWFAQYGQMGCTIIVAALLACFDLRHTTVDPWLTVLITVCLTGVLGTLLKRLAGRVRPGHDQAGRFLGPSWKHDSARESFPSTHTACAVALSYVLVSYYPAGAPVFWTLAAACGVLRYVLDAHWPSDVLAGAALGSGMGAACWYLLPTH
jgi:membrane-associated phospholipid phosphatase